MVADFGMEITHLRVFLDIKAILHISTYGQALGLVYGDHPISLWAFEYVKLDDTFLGGHDNSELG